MRIEIAGIIAGLALCAGAQCPRGSYAFTHAKVITVSGGTLSGANVMVCDGVITAVGSDAAVPSGAQVVDATGMTIYPGIVDGFSQYGLPAPPANAGRGGGRGAGGAQAIAAQNAEIANTLDGIPVNDPRRYIDPEAAGVASDRITAELLDPPATLAAVRDAGVLATLVAPADGIFKGWSAVVNLIGPDAAAMIVNPDAGEVVELAPAGRGSYPSSVMGAVAVYRQTMLDTQRLGTEMGIYRQAGEKGLPPPAYDPKAMSLLPLLRRQGPTFFVASDWDGILRALALAKEFGLTPTIIGATEAQKAIPQLQAAHAGVLVSLAFAAGGGGRGGFGGGRGGASPEILAEQRAAAESTPAALAKAGIAFGFTTQGMNANQNVFTQAKLAMGKGLSEADAWKALTLNAAQAIGAGNQLGSVEPGKIANLVVASGDPLGADTVTNKWIMVAGKLLPVHPAPAASGRGRGGRNGEGQ